MASLSASPSASAASSAPSSPMRSRHENETPELPRPSSSFYSTIMTPITFVTFLFSLLLVDIRYSITRANGHPDPNSRLPPWLHQLVYRRQPYSQQGNGDQPGRWYYHSKQKKLMRMEASEAFEMHTSVMLVLAVTATAVAGVSGYVASRLYYAFLAPTWTPVAVAQAGSAM